MTAAAAGPRKRSRASARKAGPDFERKTADYWQDSLDQPFIDRRVKTGAKDKGDIANVRLAGHRIVVECKEERAIDLAGWITEAQKEAENDGALCGIVVAKRVKKGRPEDQYAIMTQGDLMKILSLIPRS